LVQIFSLESCSQTPSAYALPLIWQTSRFTSIQNHYQNYGFVYFNLYIPGQFRTITILKSFDKQNNDSNLTCKEAHDLLMHKLQLSKCNVSWAFSIKQTITFKFPLIATFYLLFLTNTVPLKVVSPLKIYQHTKFHGPELTGSGFASNSEVWKSAILGRLKLRD
jgi:hypothetical protein